MQVKMVKEIAYGHLKLRVRTGGLHLIITSLRMVVTIKTAREARGSEQNEESHWADTDDKKD